MLCAPLPSKRPKTAQKLLQIARCISALKIALNCTEMPLTRRFFACSFAFFRVIALLSVCVITNTYPPGWEKYHRACAESKQKRDGICSIALLLAAHPFLGNALPGGIYGRRLLPGKPAAHRLLRLMLLPSGPDMVHRCRLHRTRRSTLLADPRPHKLKPQNGDCTLL